MDAKEPQAGRAACAPSSHAAVQNFLETLLLEPAQGLQKGPEETEQSKIAPSLLMAWDLVDVLVAQKPRERAD